MAQLRVPLVSIHAAVFSYPQGGIRDEIPRTNCERVYIGKTGRSLGTLTRAKEHRKKVEDTTRSIH